MKLYDFFGSASAFRVRIVLNLKGIEYERIPVNIMKGEQHLPDYLAINPAAMVPCLSDDNRSVTDSVAIMEYLEETHPDPALLPASPLERARVRGLVMAISSGIQPLHTPRVATYMTGKLGNEADQFEAWSKHWINKGLAAVETLLAAGDETGKFCHGDSPTLADAVLVSQVYAGAKRFGLEISTPCPTVWRIYNTCMAMSEFDDAAPHSLAPAK